MIRLSIFTITFLSFLLFSCDSLNDMSKKSDKDKEDTVTETDDTSTWSDDEGLFLSDIFELADDAAEVANAAMLDLGEGEIDDEAVARIKTFMDGFDADRLTKIAEKFIKLGDKDLSGGISLEEFLDIKIKKDGELPEAAKELRTDLFKKFAEGDALDIEALKKMFKERKFVVKRAEMIRKVADKHKDKFEPFRSRVCFVLKKGFGEALGGVHEKFRAKWMDRCKDIDGEEDEGEDDVDDDKRIFNTLPRDLADCEADADCMLVDSFCSKRPINKKYEDAYKVWWEKRSTLADMTMCPAVFVPDDVAVKCSKFAWATNSKCQLDLGFGLPGEAED